MNVLRDDIAAFDRMRPELESEHHNEWVLFHKGQFAGVFPDFESAAASAVERFDVGPYLIRQVGALPIPLSGGMVFTPAHVLQRVAVQVGRLSRQSEKDALDWLEAVSEFDAPGQSSHV